MSDFRLTHEGPKRFAVHREKKRLFRRSIWERMGTFKTEAEALKFIKQNAEFEPHTSYYDKHGNLYVTPTDW